MAPMRMAKTPAAVNFIVDEETRVVTRGLCPRSILCFGRAHDVV